MKHSRQAKPPPVSSKAAGAGSGAASPQAQDVQALLVDIFALTGQKVEIDDPIVAAALIHSALLRRAGQDAAKAIEQAVERTHAPQPPDDNLQRAIGWLVPWHGKVILGIILFVICFAASVLGSLLVSSFH